MNTGLALMISGNLGFELLKKLQLEREIAFVATDKSSQEIISYCQKFAIPIFIGNPRKGRLKEFIRSFDAHVLLSINYLFLIERDVIEFFQYAINFHGSLLPKYRGRTPHVWAVINNEKFCGVTAHFIDDGCDTGAVILQKIITIEDDETGNDILQKYNITYPLVVDEVLRYLDSDSLPSYPQDEKYATYFGKRTPEDGEIDWNWQRERIKNWVRALSYPYPGAFTYLNGHKLTIDKVEFSELGFNSSMPNGSIVSYDGNIIVKTPNGAIELSQIRNLKISNLNLDKKILGK